MSGISGVELGALAFGLVFASILAGLLAGFLGVGGGIILVPVLYWLFGILSVAEEVAMHLAVGTSLATIVFTALSSARAHFRRGTVDIDLLKLWVPAIGVGALCGGFGARFIDGDLLRTIFGVVALLVAVNFSTRRSLVVASRLPDFSSVQCTLGFIIGIVSSLMGIGGGTLAVPVLVAFSIPIARAVGTASAFGFAIAVPGALGFVYSGLYVADRLPFSLGFVNVAAVAVVLPFTIIFAPLGARLSHSVSPLLVKRCFAAFLSITALRMLWPV